MSEAREVEKFPFPNLLLVTLTYDCQMRCTYCDMWRVRRPVDMSLPVLKRSLDFILASRDDEIEIQFFGGEPLLRFDLIRRAVKYIDAARGLKSKSVRYSITTNCVSLTKKQLDFFTERNFSFILSLDGLAETQKQQRPFACAGGAGDWRVQWKNVCSILDRGLEYFVNMVVTPQNVSDMHSNAMQIISCGIRHLRLSYQVGSHWDAGHRLRYIRGLSRIIRETAQMDGIEILNLNCSDDEPVIISPAITVDCDGSMYLGCTIPIRKMLPALLNANRLGTVFELESINRVRISQSSWKKKVLGAFPSRSRGRKIVESNLIIGECSKKLARRVTRMGGSRV